jgi:hypothetical protein
VCVSKRLAGQLLSLQAGTITLQGEDSASATALSAFFSGSQSSDLIEAGPAGSGNQDGASENDQKNVPSQEGAQVFTAASAAEQLQPSLGSQFVLFCVDNANMGLDAAMIGLQYSSDSTQSYVSGDHEFFSALRTRYISLRGKWRWYLDPIQFSFCHFAKFDKWDIERLGYLKKEFPSVLEYDFMVDPPMEPYYDPISKHEWEQRFYHRVENRYR